MTSTFTEVVHIFIKGAAEAYRRVQDFLDALKIH